MISWIIPESSHTFNSGLNVAPRITVKIGVVEVVPNDIPLIVACGFAESLTLKVTVLRISAGA